MLEYALFAQTLIVWTLIIIKYLVQSSYWYVFYRDAKPQDCNHRTFQATAEI